MKRPSTIVTLLTILITPLLAVADDQVWMPLEWNPTYPAPPSVDRVQLIQLLAANGVITDQEDAQLI